MLEVDFAHLGTIPPFLRSVAATVTDRGRPAVADANRAAHPRHDGIDCALGSSLIAEASELSRALQGTFSAVDANLRAVAESLEETAKAVVRIGQRYKTAEDLNQASAAEIASLLPR